MDGRRRRSRRETGRGGRFRAGKGAAGWPRTNSSSSPPACQTASTVDITGRSAEPMSWGRTDGSPRYFWEGSDGPRRSRGPMPAAGSRRSDPALAARGELPAYRQRASAAAAGIRGRSQSPMDVGRGSGRHSSRDLRRSGQPGRFRPGGRGLHHPQPTGGRTLGVNSRRRSERPIAVRAGDASGRGLAQPSGCFSGRPGSGRHHLEPGPGRPTSRPHRRRAVLPEPGDRRQSSARGERSGPGW